FDDESEAEDDAELDRGLEQALARRRVVDLVPHVVEEPGQVDDDGGGFEELAGHAVEPRRELAEEGRGARRLLGLDAALRGDAALKLLDEPVALGVVLQGADKALQLLRGRRDLGRRARLARRSRRSALREPLGRAGKEEEERQSGARQKRQRGL